MLFKEKWCNDFEYCKRNRNKQRGKTQIFNIPSGDKQAIFILLFEAVNVLLRMFTDLMTFDLSDRSLLRAPEHLSTPVVTEELVLTQLH